MSDTENTKAHGTAIEDGAIASAIIEALFIKGILALDESRGVIDSAMRAVSPHIKTPEGNAAAEIIAGVRREKFSQHGQHE